MISKIEFLRWLGYEKDWMWDTWEHSSLILGKMTSMEIAVFGWWRLLYGVFIYPHGGKV